MTPAAPRAILGLLISGAGDRELLQSFLQQSGHGVLILAAVRGPDALVQPDLIIVDEPHAGASSGTLQEWKQLARPLHLPILVLLSAKSPSLLWLRSGYDDVLRMPVSKEELLARVDAFLRIRRASEQVELQNEERFRFTLDRAPIGIAHCTMDGRFIRVNRHLCEMLQLDREEMLGLELGQLTSAEDSGAPLAIHHPSKHRETRAEYEVRHRRRDGALVWLRVNLWRVDDPARDLRYIVVIIEDFTERREVAARLAQANAELERRVDERTAQLRSANEDLEAFTSSVSHDLRAPVRAIQGFSDLLVAEAGDKLDGRAAHLLLRLSSAAGRMGSLIDGLLALSRAARVPLSRSTVDLSAMAREILAELSAQAPARRFQVEISGDTTCSGDAALLRQVLDNLIGNAWKYCTYRDETRIELGAGPASASGEREFHVRDNGAGFDPEHGGKLFQPFERLHSESEFPGVGVGLATVHRIISRHGGRIRAEGRPGQGAAFYFTLPAAA